MDPNPLKAQIDTLIENLCKETSEAAISKTFSNYLAAMSKFYQYSFFNSRLILFANPAASQVAGYKAWNKFNRYVKRGEHGIPILAPCLVKDKETNTSKIVGFKTAFVFDISQTEGDPLPEMPEWKSSSIDQSIHQKLLDFAELKNITVEVAELPGAQGISMGGKIILAPTAGTKTLVHEIAHELLHANKDQVTVDRQRREVEAESVAYVVCSYFGMQSLTSPNYLALWCAEPKTIKASLAAIQITAKQIIDYINPKTTLEEE